MTTTINLTSSRGQQLEVCVDADGLVEIPGWPHPLRVDVSNVHLLVALAIRGRRGLGGEEPATVFDWVARDVLEGKQPAKNTGTWSVSTSTAPQQQQHAPGVCQTCGGTGMVAASIAGVPGFTVACTACKGSR